MENRIPGDRKAALEVIKHFVLLVAAGKGGRQEMELQELADHDEFIIEQFHLFEEKVADGQNVSITDQINEVVEDILHNNKGRVR